MALAPRHLLAGLVGLAAPLFVSEVAHATHFRYGNITYERPDPTNAPLSVRFTVTVAWRMGYLPIDSTTLNFGDGANNGATQGVQIGQGVDAAGEQYRVMQYIVTHNYPSVGQYTANFTSCCRLSNLINAGDDSFNVSAKVDLTGSNTGNAKTYLPAIIQLQTGGVRTHFIPASDPDGSPVTCRFATTTEAGDAATTLPPRIPATNAAPTLAASSNPPGCVLSWNTASGVAGNQFAVQVVLESANPSNPNLSSAVNDYIIELVSAPPPTCTGTASYVIPMGSAYSSMMTGTNVGGGALTFDAIYSNGTLNPLPGVTQASPFTVTHSWTPGPGEQGTALITGVFTNAQNLSGYCTKTVIVPNCAVYGQPCSAGIGGCYKSGIMRCMTDGTEYCDAVAGNPQQETCNGVDDDCNGTIDDNNPESGQDCTSSFPGACAGGLTNCNAGNLECIANVAPGTLTETCNGIDDDCNGTIDDGFNVGFACDAGIGACKQSGAIVCDANGQAMCDAVPGMPQNETCNGIDDNCDGVIDDGFGLGDMCTDGQGVCQVSGTVICDANGNPTCSVTAGDGTPEVCGNQIDEDCDGQLNNGCECVVDSDCGSLTSARVCDGDSGAFACVDGCRGTNGNGCQAGKVCTSSDATIGTCVTCLTDADCGSTTSGLVCNDVHECIAGCRGSNGNGCPEGELCSSDDSSIGTCSPGTGGSGGSGASGGSAGSGAGGSSGSGGSAGSGATSGSGGTTAGGSGGSGGSGATAGSAGTGGASAGTAGTAGSTGANTPPASDDSGCGCTVPGQSHSRPVMNLAALSALGLLVTRLRKRAK